MPTPSLTNEICLEAIRLVEQHGTMTAAADASGIDRRTLGHRYHTGVKRGLNDELVAAAPSGHRIRGVSTNYTGDGKIISQWVKTTRNEVPIEEIIDRLSGAFADVGTRAPLIPRPKKLNGDLLTVYPLIDWHIGLLAWARETGENYDLKIARQTIMSAMSGLIDATPPAEQAIVLGIGDMLHFDGYDPVTPASKHQLDTDGRYPLVLDTAADMVEETIELALAKHGTVLARILPGNHDPVSSVALALMLKRIFRGHKRVTIDSSHSYQWWHRVGKVFLGATHGDKTKMKDMPLLMAADRPDDWAASKYRRVYTGHFHSEKSFEEGGVIVSCMRTPVARDAFHSFNRWRSGRSVYSETFKLDGSEAAAIQMNI